MRVFLMSVWLWLLIAVVIVLVVPVAMRFAEEEPDNGITHESGRPEDEDPDGMLVKAA